MAKTLLPSWSDCVIGIVVIVLFCVTLLLNILALHYTYSKIRRPSNKKIPHLLVGALSLSGLGIAVFEYPPFIASRFKGEWLYDSGVCNFVAFVVVLFGNLTICLVVLMSLERLGAIVFPFFYKQYVNFRKAVIILLFLVGYSVFLAVLPIILDRIRLNVSTGVCTYAVDSYNTNTKIVVAVMVTHYISAIIIMFVSNMVVVRTVSMLDRNTMSGEYKNRSGERKQHNSHACLNFAKMVGVLAFCYTVCWTVILMRILLLYVYGWRNYYYDQLVIVLTTFDPLINHCVCLWIMRKYRDGYASSMGSLMSCFKISDDGIWATTITRLSTISRRSTYSRASTRSSSRQSSKPYFYKQVPQNADNPQQELYPEGGDLPDQTARNRQEIEEDKISDRKIFSDDKREWSEIIRELKAEKDRQDQEPSSSRGSEDIKVVEKGALHDPVPGTRETAKVRWRNAFKKLMSLKTESESVNLENQEKFPEVLQGSISGSKDALATLHEERDDSSEQPSAASGGGEDVRAQKEEPSHSLQRSSSDDIEAKDQWTKILQKLNEEAKTETSASCPLPTDEKQAGSRASDDSAPGKSSSLPELVRDIKATRTQEVPELIKDGATGKMEGAERQTDLPEILQDTSGKDDGTPSDVSTNLETRELQRKSMQDSEQSVDRKHGSGRAEEKKD